MITSVSGILAPLFALVTASASEYAALPGSCRKPPGALYLEEGRGLRGPFFLLLAFEQAFDYSRGMGWNDGPSTWGEMERVLTSKPRRAGSRLPEPTGDGGDSPAWSRKRGELRAARPTRRGTLASIPYAELHAHSAYSFLDGASTPEELVEEAARLDLRAIALTDHDGLYGVVRFAEAAKELDVQTVFGAELSLGNVARTEDARPAGAAPAGAGARARGLPPVVARAGQGAPGRRGEGQAALRLRRADRGGGRALARPHRMPQRPCAPSTFDGRTGGGRGGARRPGRPVRAPTG